MLLDSTIYKLIKISIDNKEKNCRMEIEKKGQKKEKE